MVPARFCWRGRGLECIHRSVRARNLSGIPLRDGQPPSPPSLHLSPTIRRKQRQRMLYRYVAGKPSIHLPSICSAVGTLAGAASYPRPIAPLESASSAPTYHPPWRHCAAIDQAATLCL
ncbi:hypothetical protein CGRA01v4_03318 [Colletotrichum graminicola]|nr:hypothetical protein CGRA01v4_03318 [Colletotrichum graminicola]